MDYTNLVESWPQESRNKYGGGNIMPYILSPVISEELPALWGEGQPYTKQTIYDINSSDISKPPVQYNQYTLKPHSLPHMDAPGHIIPEGCGVDWFFKNKKLDGFYGATTVLQFSGENFNPTPGVNGQFHREITKQQLLEKLKEVGSGKTKRIFISTKNHPVNSVGMHDPNYALTLSPEAAEFLLSQGLCTFGTSWKSTDYQPGKRERPIHKIFLSKKVVIFECLNLKNVPEGEYFLSAFPLPLQGASESPCCPVLFSKGELAF